MKKLLFIPVLFACFMGMGQAAASLNVIGKPIKIGYFIVAENDFPNKLYWKEAKVACTKLGKGWRLPTKSELNIMYINKGKIGGFERYSYWSSSEYVTNFAWGQDFYNGNTGYSGKDDNDSPFYVRAVRTF